MDEEIYITDININKVRNIENFDIHISDTEKKHLIITGKNGSGKTSLLVEIKNFLNASPLAYAYYKDLFNSKDVLSLLNRKNNLSLAEDIKKKEYEKLQKTIKAYKYKAKYFGKTKVHFCNKEELFDYNIYKKFIFAFFGAKRDISLKIPTGINKIDIKPKYDIEEKAGNDFIQYIVNLKADRSFAKDDNDLETVNKIDEWFKIFEENLFKIFDTKDVELEFDRKSYNFNIVEKGKEPYNLTQLSDGFSSILNIVTDLIMRMEIHKTKSYDVQGVVLIDEIETHLHVDLQKKIFPFLTSFFPKIQFIVTTHSPFVITSIENAVICDLEKRIVTTDLSGYSYEDIIESYFDSDKYSSVLKLKVEKYELLMDKDNLNKTEEKNLLELEEYLKNLPKLYSEELELKIQQIKLKKIGKRIK
ncbi:MAG: AAA family ATPase [Cyanobacteriota bacterium]